MISLVVINYKKPELAVGLCRSLAKVSGHERVRVLVVDNAADAVSRGVLGGLKIEGLSIEVLHEETNWGYFGGARVGLAHLRQKPLDEWVIISNSDIELTDPAFIEKLESISPVGIGVIGPKILSALSGTNSNPYMIDRPAASKMQFYKRVFSNAFTCFAYQMLGLGKALLKNAFGMRAPEIEARDIYAPHGAFLIFSREYFERGGSFEHAPFLFGEEVTVAENCRRLGLKARYEPSLIVSHIEHATIGNIPSRKMLGFQREASAFCADTYFSSKT